MKIFRKDRQIRTLKGRIKDQETRIYILEQEIDMARHDFDSTAIRISTALDMVNNIEEQLKKETEEKLKWKAKYFNLVKNLKI